MNEISRRTVARGAAWTVPVLSVAAAAPSLAASSPDPTVTGSICEIFYGSGAVNYQVMDVFLGVYTSTGVIPAGTIATWSVQTSQSAAIPTTNYSDNNLWKLSLSPSTGSPTAHIVTIAFLSEYDTGVSGPTTWCAPRLVYNDTYPIRPKTDFTITSNAAGPDITLGGAGSLKWTVAKRHVPNTAMKFISKSGAQSCYPEVQYSHGERGNFTGCGDESNDTSTEYPDGTCVRIQHKSGNVIVPAVC